MPFPLHHPAVDLWLIWPVWAALAGTPLALAALVVLTAAFWLKAGVEEDFLAAELGHDAYRAYATCVRRLVPLLF